MEHDDDDVICVSKDSDDDKLREFEKICDSKPLEFEEESLGEICFGDTQTMKDVDSMDDSASAKEWNNLFDEENDAINDENDCSMCTENDDDNDSSKNDDINEDDCSMSGEEGDNDSNNSSNCDDEDCSMHTDDDDSDDDDKYCCCQACWMYKHGHVRDPVPLEIIAEAMKWAETNSSEIAASIYSELAPILKNRTVIQIQVYGSGELDFTEKESGPLQLAIAFNLMHRLKGKFPEISITCQEPRYVESEKEYLRTKGVKVLETEEFSSEHFIQASKAAKNISNATFICYMIGGMYHMNNEFLEAHWNPDILSRCIFISNNPEYGPPFPKLREFGKICNSKPLKFEEESLGEICFGDTCIYSISKENAKSLINLFK
uniref:SRR1-like domain-containing protein n=1 Tax=Panagrolaimus sp. PS1159 TaxID=55785 RepID=A0AC35FQ73_9BILA